MLDHDDEIIMVPLSIDGVKVIEEVDSSGVKSWYGRIVSQIYNYLSTQPKHGEEFEVESDADFESPVTFSLFGQWMETITVYNPESKPILWFSLNFMLLIFASCVSFAEYQRREKEAYFPTLLYTVYQVVSITIWCVEAFSSSLYYMKLSEKCRIVMYLELLVAVYLLSSTFLFIWDGSKLSLTDQASALKSTELDVIIYSSACAYNIYCATKVPENDPADPEEDTKALQDKLPLTISIDCDREIPKKDRISDTQFVTKL